MNKITNSKLQSPCLKKGGGRQEIKMKKTIIVISLILLLSFCFPGYSRAHPGVSPQKQVDEDPGEVYREIYRLYGKKEYDKALNVIEQALKDFGSTKRLLQMKYNILTAQKKYDEVLSFIDKEIKKSGESEELLSAKYNVLFMQQKWQEALKAALQKDKIARIKSPWDCINIVHAYIQMGSKSDALDWLQEAVNRGFISYRILVEPKYGLLQKEKRFYEIIESIKVSIGLGRPARNFNARLLSDEAFTLSQQRGKVVLVIFWATWCEPCREELPRLKKYYDQLKDKGFEIIAISLDSDKNRARKYIRENKLEWKNVCSGKVWGDHIVKRYKVNSIPSHWLIDRKGILRSFDLKGEELRKAIVYLLSQK
jgi:peroxiredoxin